MVYLLYWSQSRSARLCINRECRYSSHVVWSENILRAQSVFTLSYFTFFAWFVDVVVVVVVNPIEKKRNDAMASELTKEFHTFNLSN